ncbi:DUF167 domain-containing protein [Pseudodesulfovibrio hydrargyri]|uniref:DUF167 domain-containing protein n=1 Tax=Pseudodesulfovibrio hydrargyri TaxID=2125990 RepID=UPI0009FF0A99|nr:DUF167 domain-containing protein [Pseudodesulfovibrio hydrargyri]
MFVSKRESGWSLDVWAQPGARKDEIAGEYQGCLKVRLRAPAVDNKANKGLVAYIARLLRLKKSQVEITSGHSSRKKNLALNTAGEPDWGSLLSGLSPR